MDDHVLRDQVNRFTGGRELPPADMAAVRTFITLNERLAQCRECVEIQGAFIVTDSGVVENPALDTERRTSAEIRGWIDKRPDLFGKDAAAREAAAVDPTVVKAQQYAQEARQLRVVRAN